VGLERGHALFRAVHDGAVSQPRSLYDARWKSFAVDKPTRAAVMEVASRLLVELG
jgi:hypothetical protein